MLDAIVAFDAHDDLFSSSVNDLCSAIRTGRHHIAFLIGNNAVTCMSLCSQNEKKNDKGSEEPIEIYFHQKFHGRMCCSRPSLMYCRAVSKS